MAVAALNGTNQVFASVVIRKLYLTIPINVLERIQLLPLFVISQAVLPPAHLPQRLMQRSLLQVYRQELWGNLIQQLFVTPDG